MDLKSGRPRIGLCGRAHKHKPEPARMNWNWCHFWLRLLLVVWVSWSSWWLRHGAKQMHLSQESQKAKEDPGAGGEVVDPATGLHKSGELTHKWQCVWATHIITAASFLPSESCTRISLVVYPDQKHTRKVILGNVETLQSYHTGLRKLNNVCVPNDTTTWGINNNNYNSLNIFCVLVLQH